MSKSFKDPLDPENWIYGHTRPPRRGAVREVIDKDGNSRWISPVFHVSPKSWVYFKS